MDAAAFANSRIATAAIVSFGRGEFHEFQAMFEREKFKRLVHYVIWRAGNHDWFGAVKLNSLGARRWRKCCVRPLPERSSVPRYYIDTDDEELLAIDEEGFDLPGPLEARAMALGTLPEIARERLPRGDRRVVSARVLNDEGVVIYSAELVVVGEWHVEPPEDVGTPQ